MSKNNIIRYFRYSIIVFIISFCLGALKGIIELLLKNTNYPYELIGDVFIVFGIIIASCIIGFRFRKEKDTEIQKEVTKKIRDK